ncbi:delta-60 repeat domain-containing protein [Dokdonella sp.]|uniref:delta-60 repeat domain-containing protein n=1 Tax=Dokdonella sp. TaxID=2291710 RepID=UPI0025BEEAFB|nr:delta-60 repeat domain-containing protein [Dokdonella sp.]MBX3693030.1 hypothetical protein [Dokdonella sp.]MCW5568842.1 hypothetical protein [Dokdonella sp.]
MNRDRRGLARRARFLAAGTILLGAGLASTAQADHGLDPTYFPSLGYFVDIFATVSGQSARYGGKHAVLPNGDIVVAGIVRLENDTIAPYWNIGLVRYSPQGYPRLWTGSGGPYFHNFNQYVLYPNLTNGGTGDALIESVEDIAYAEGKIYVLVTRVFGGVERDAAVVVFNEDGTFQQNLSVIASTANEYARALEVTVTGITAKPVTLTVLAERYAPLARMVVTKLNLGSNGLLSADANFNGGAPLVVPFNCTGGGCGFYAGDIARPKRFFQGDGMPIYVVGSAQYNGPDWDFAVVRINANGTIDTSFGAGGTNYFDFSEPGSDSGDFAYRLDIDSGIPGLTADTLFIAGNVRRSCKDGIGIVAVTSENQIPAGFGVGGRVVHGGSSETGTICAQEASLYLGDLARQGNELAVAGTTASLDQGGTLRVDGALLRVDATNGSQRGLARLPIEYQGERFGDARLRGISHAGQGRYLVSGDLTNTIANLGPVFLSAAVAPSDRIFADGFDRSVVLPTL